MAVFQSKDDRARSSIRPDEPDNRRTLEAADMPRERLCRCGPEALKDHELVAILLGTGYRGTSP